VVLYERFYHAQSSPGSNEHNFEWPAWAREARPSCPSLDWFLEPPKACMSIGKSLCLVSEFYQSCGDSIYVRTLGKAHSPREDVLKISHGSEPCQNVSFLQGSRRHNINTRELDEARKPQWLLFQFLAPIIGHLQYCCCSWCCSWCWCCMLPPRHRLRLDRLKVAVSLLRSASELLMLPMPQPERPPASPHPPHHHNRRRC
jgi:hypothetical protein